MMGGSLTWFTTWLCEHSWGTWCSLTWLCFLYLLLLLNCCYMTVTATASWRYGQDLQRLLSTASIGHTFPSWSFLPWYEEVPCVTRTLMLYKRFVEGRSGRKPLGQLLFPRPWLGRDLSKNFVLIAGGCKMGNPAVWLQSFNERAHKELCLFWNPSLSQQPVCSQVPLV